MLISVNGGAADFDLAAEKQQTVLQALRKADENMSCWFLSAGTNSGVMRMLGKAKAMIKPQTPLIGFVPLHVLSENQLRRMRIDRVKYCEDDTSEQFFELEENHTHFFLVKEEGRSRTSSEDFDTSVTATAAFEQMVRMGESVDGSPPRVSDSPNRNRIRDFSKMPYVCMCIEGGIGTILQCHRASQEGMAILCIKGSGRAADFLGDLALLRFDDQDDSRSPSLLPYVIG